MPSGSGGMATGSDTRLYNPKSEASHMYTANSEDEESYKHGIGDPESMEKRRDKLQAEKENAEKVMDLPHLRLETVEPKPDLPPGMEEEDQDQPIMDDGNENAVGAEISQMTGMPGQGGPDASAMFGAQVNQPFGQQTIATSEPMADAWSSLLKEHKPWHQPQMETTPYGRSKSDKISEIRGKNVASKLGHPADKGGLNEAPLALHRGHRQTTQPISLFPEKYQQSLGRQASRRLMGGIEMPKGMQARPMQGERPKNPSQPKPPKMPAEIAMPKEPSMKLASVGALKKDIQTVRKKMDYMRFNQLRRLLERLKGKIGDRRLKMADPGGVGESGPGAGNQATYPTGATESIDGDERQEGSKSPSGKKFGSNMGRSG
ncbi:hypothetical protein OAA43_00415 [bacterium]|nr:hypothetical protein [bacterium]